MFAVEADLVARADSGRFSGQIEGEQRGIPARFAEAGVQQAAPKIGDAGMLQAIVIALLCGVADGDDVVSRSGDLAAISRGDFKFAIFSGYVARDDLTIAQLHASGCEETMPLTASHFTVISPAESVFKSKLLPSDFTIVPVSRSPFSA